MTSCPLVLLDVDGVLNAFGGDRGDPPSGPDWRSGYAVSNDVSWPITWSPAVVAHLSTWHEEGVVELQWLTTWGHAANDDLRQLLGLPRLDVAGTYEEEDGIVGVFGSRAGASHASVTPSAPDPLSGQWWKYDVVRRVLREHPDRLVIWIDDELHEADSPFRSWASSERSLLVIGPDPRTGLIREDIESVDRALVQNRMLGPRVN